MIARIVSSFLIVKLYNYDYNYDLVEGCKKFSASKLGINVI